MIVACSSLRAADHRGCARLRISSNPALWLVTTRSEGRIRPMDSQHSEVDCEFWRYLPIAPDLKSGPEPLSLVKLQDSTRHGVVQICCVIAERSRNK